MADNLSIVCNSCMYAVKASERNAHYRSEWHRYNVKRQVANLPPMPLDIFDSKLTALKTKQGEEAQERASHYCALCNKSSASAAGHAQHITSKMHLKRVTKKEISASTSASSSLPQDVNGKKNSKNRNAVESRESAGRPQLSNTFAHMDITKNEGEDAEAEEEDDEEAPELVDADSDDQTFTRQQQKKTTGGIVYAGPTKKLVKVNKQVPKQQEEDDFEIDESKSIPLMSCLFCNRSFSTVDKSLQHMLKAHGFFVPFTEYLVDMNGLLKYLGAKVGAGRVCLWCNAPSFGDVRAIQQHMIDKDHCKINFDDEEEEFVEYYRFPGDEMDEDYEGDEGDEGDETDEYESGYPKRGIRDLNSANELVLASGAILGHRDYRRVYNQNVRPETELQASDRAHRLLIGGARTSGQLIASSRAELKKTHNERQHHTKAFKNAVKNRLAHEYRANQQKHFVDQTGVY